MRTAVACLAVVYSVRDGHVHVKTPIVLGGAECSPEKHIFVSNARSSTAKRELAPGPSKHLAPS